jgi:hypothetical protein
MQVKKLLVISLILGLIFSVYFLINSNQVVAQENSEEVEEENAEKAGELFDKISERLEKAELRIEKAPMSLVITPKKKVTLVNVELKEIATSTATLKVGIFGLTFTVDTSQAKILGGGKELSISDLKVGERLLIKGVVDETTGIIRAERVHDRTFNKETIEGLRSKIQELLKMIEELRKRLKTM